MKRPRADRHPEVTKPAADPAKTSSRTFWLSLLVMELLVFAVHLNGLRHNHLEGDEIIFTFLAERLAQDPWAYHLQGSLEGRPARRFIEEVWEPLNQKRYPHLTTAEVLKTAPDHQGRQLVAYDAEIYDQPMFFHPPLYPYSLAIARTVFGSRSGVLLSAICHGLTIFFLALLASMLVNETLALIAAALVAIESISWICGERLWIDGMLQTAVTGAMLAACWSARRGGTWRFVISGVCLGLAGLTKLPAGLLAPAVVASWLVLKRRPAIIEVIGYMIGCLALVVPWTIITKVNYGAFFPSAHPTEWLMAHYPYVKMIVNRPVTYYVVGLLLASPILSYGVFSLARIRRDKWLWIPIIWAGGFIATFAVMGIGGLGFQLRYLSPAIPGLCMLAAAGLTWLPSWCRVPLFPLAAYTLYVGVVTGMGPFLVDPVPVDVARYLQEVFNVTLWDIFPGMW